MIAIRRLLGDRRRSQRGGVLSGVLIILAFLAIISGALMTELSTNFLLSKTLVNRIANEATVNSAIEVSLDKLQNSPIASGCPALPGPVTLNQLTAVASYVSCAPVVDVRSPQFTNIASSAAFNIDGTHSVLPVNSADLFLVGDSGGTVYQYTFGRSTPNWAPLNVGSAVTGPPLAMTDQSDGTGELGDISNLIPIAGGGSSGCTAPACVVLKAQNSGTIDMSCLMPAGGPVTSRPAAGLAYPANVYFGDRNGTVFAYNATENNGPCALMGSRATTNNAAVIAGPVVFQRGTDEEIFVVTANGGTSQLLRFEYDQTDSPALSLQSGDTITLPYANPVGLAVETTTLPARLAITFAGGQVEIIQINSSSHPSPVASAGLGTAVAAAPYWCSCPSGPLIGVGGQNGTLYVIDTNLNLAASYAGGSPIRTTPASDAVGEWFYGAEDGYLHELQQVSGQSSLLPIRTYGPSGGGAMRSSALVGSCPAGICVYLGSMDGSAYLVPLDARDATITACLSTAPPACSGVNPRLWAKVEIGSASSQRTVHVGGWSYYSP